jgi:hypothetical protein
VLFKHKDKTHKVNKLRVDLGELHDEKDHLIRFLQLIQKIDVTPISNELIVTSEELSPEELKQKVTKYIYYRNLNNTYWVELHGSVIRFKKFKPDKKEKKPEKEGTTPSIISHGW